MNSKENIALSSLTAISPIDGRYWNITNKLSEYYSEYGLIKKRIHIEIEYFIKLCKTIPELKELNLQQYNKIKNIYENFTIHDAEEIKYIEKTINHDVKSVEYFIKKKFKEIGLSKYTEYIHFGLTSQDINNTALPYLVSKSLNKIINPVYLDIKNKIYDLASKWINIPMLSRTHGQPASPTYLGKEMFVFYERIFNQVNQLNNCRLFGKFGGAIGNFNAHYIAYPNIDWIKFGNDFLNSLNLDRSQFTTQIDHYDSLSQIFDNIRRINNILVDLNRDIWSYISLEYFKLLIVDGEIGSSTMPHKVNPINFENSEANLLTSNALLDFLSNKLPISRLQRDLTDSSVTRNIGVAISHCYLGYISLLKGLNKLEVNIEKINQDLNNNWMIIAEGIQTILRREKYPNSYELLKQLTRKNNKIGKEEIHKFIDNLDISLELKNEMKNISPYNYTGKYLDVFNN